MDGQDTHSDLQQQLKDKDQFLATISHEIRSPMNGVFGMADALLRTDLDDLQKRYLSVLIDACDSMLSIANQVLDISKTKTGQVKLAPVDFDLNDFMMLQVATFEKRAEARGLTMELETDFLTNPLIHFDKFRLGQVVTNLVSNALRYTDKGKITVRASLIPIDVDCAELILSVIDTGIGMSDNAKDGIFEAFGSANPEESAARGGTGLGLTVVRDLVEMLGGEIEVVSTLGKGSNFTVKFSVRHSIEMLKPSNSAQKTIPKNLNILLAEDSDSNAFVFQVMLEETGLSITRAKNGAEAVHHVKNGAFDVVFMDLQMPVLDGISATKQIRNYETSADKKPTNVIALSADIFANQNTAFLEAGFNDSLSKPFRVGELLDMLSSVNKD